MPSGLQVWNASGHLIVDITTRTGRVVYTQSVTSGASGSVNLPLLSEGTPWSGYINDTIGRMPLITITGTLVSWSFPDGFSQGTLLVGVY